MAKEFKIGLIALISGLVLFYGFNFLKGVDFLSSTNKYFVIYEKVDGLIKSNPVIINGLAVGKVSDIRLLQSRKNKILVELTVNEDVLIGDSTVAELSNTDFLGSKAIILKTKKIKDFFQPGDTLFPYVDRGLEEYFDSVQPITNNLSVTISRINEILLGLQGSGEKINSTLDDLQTTVREVNSLLKTNKNEFKVIMSSTREFIQNANDRIEQLDPILRKTEGVLDTLNGINFNETLYTLNLLLEDLRQTVIDIDNGQGTIGKLMTNDSLYNNLNQLLIDLDKLSIHFNNYPKDFLKPLGRKNSKLEGIEKSGGN